MIDLTDRRNLITFLKDHRLWLNRRAGQHFLIDSRIRDQIVAAAELQLTDTVLEIGPGLGSLTQGLASHLKVGLLLLIERDPKLVAILRDEFEYSRHVKVIHDDILRYDLTQIQGSYQVVSNLPYQITGVVLRRLLSPESSHRPDQVTLMLQKEVIDRLLARPGSAERGVPTLLVELYGNARLVCAVPKTAFFPEPEVDSAVITIRPHPQPFPIDEALGILHLAKAGFAAKRRTLANALVGSFQLPKDRVQTWLDQANLSPMARAEDLTLAEWQKLTKTVDLVSESR